MAEKRFLCLFLAWIVLGFAGPALAVEKVYVNGMDANFPPFAFLDNQGNPDGFDVNAMNWIAREMGFKITHRPLDWNCIIDCLLEKDIDLIASGMSISEKGSEKVMFTIPYWTIRHVIVIGKDSVLTLAQIFTKGKRIGVQRGANDAVWIEENLLKKGGKKFTLVYYDSTALALEDLVTGQLTAIAMPEAPAQEAEKRKQASIVGTFGMPAEDFAYAVRKSDAALLEKLNAGLRKLMASPYWEELKKKYIE